MELIRYENGAALLDPDTAERIEYFERQVKAIESKAKEIKAAILAEMEDKHILKLETEHMTINYVAASDRETFDKTRFRNDHADLYDDYVKISPIKPSIRIKVD